MRRFFAIFAVLFLGVFTASSVWGVDANPSSKNQDYSSFSNNHGTQTEDPLPPLGLGIEPEGVARDVYNIMTGIRQPLDESTSLTIQMNTSLRLGLNF